MQVRTFSASLLLALLWPNTPGQPLRLQHLTPRTLEPVGRQLQLYPDYRWGFQQTSYADGVMVVRTPRAFNVIDTSSMQRIHSYPFARRDVCATGLDGPAVVALVGCRSTKAATHTLWRFTPAGRRSVPVRGLGAISWPVSFALGDGTWFIAFRGGDVAAVDLRTGAVTRHEHRRTLAKGEGSVQAAWLGRHRLGLNGTVVDVRTWHRRTLAAGARNLTASDGFVVAWGSNGITVYDDALRLYRRIAPGKVIDDASIHGGVVYAQVGLAWDLWSLRSGRHLGTVLPDTPWLVRLLPS
jgi:hypothetical protein